LSVDVGTIFQSAGVTKHTRPSGSVLYDSIPNGAVSFNGSFSSFDQELADDINLTEAPGGRPLTALEFIYRGSATGADPQPVTATVRLRRRDGTNVNGSTLLDTFVVPDLPLTPGAPNIKVARVFVDSIAVIEQNMYISVSMSTQGNSQGGLGFVPPPPVAGTTDSIVYNAFFPSSQGAFGFAILVPEPSSTATLLAFTGTALCARLRRDRRSRP
jgi:hypothetical protein